MDFVIYMLESIVKWNSTTGKSRLSWLRRSQDRQLEVSKNDTTWQQCHRKKKLVTEASDANNRLFRDSRPKESFLDDCHECHQRHWRKSKFLNSFFLFFLAYIHHTYTIHSSYYIPYKPQGQYRKILIFSLEFSTLFLVTLVTVIKKEKK